MHHDATVYDTLLDVESTGNIRVRREAKLQKLQSHSSADTGRKQRVLEVKDQRKCNVLRLPHSIKL